MTSREQFEKWVGDSINSDVHRGIMLSRHENGNYSHLATRHKWDAWQASRAAVEIELPTTIELHPFVPSAAKMFCELHKNTVAECAKSIRAAGLKIKGE